MPNYWETRFKKENTRYFEKAESAEDYILKKYKFAVNSIKKDLSLFYSEFSDSNNLISFTEARRFLTNLELLGKKDELELIMSKLSNTSDTEFLKKLNSIIKRKKVTRLEMLMTQLEGHIVKLSDTKESSIRSLLSSTLKDKFKSSFKAINTKQDLKLSFSDLTDSAIKTIIENPWSGSNYSSNIWRDKSALTDTLQQELIKGFLHGDGYNTVAANINKKIGGSINRTKALVRTETNYVIQQASRLSYEKIGVEKYLYSAIMDIRTSDICRELNGQIFNLADAVPGVNMPPMHVNCRSMILPMFDEDQEI